MIGAPVSPAVASAVTSALAALVLALGASGPPQDGFDERARAIASEYRELGFAIDLERVSFERALRSRLKRVATEQAARNGSSERTLGQYVLRAALGATDAADEAEFRARSLAALGATGSALYDYGSRTLVLSEETRGEEGDYVLAHELAHAWRDQLTPIAGLFARSAVRSEDGWVVRCLVEGEAELMADAWRGRRRGLELDAATALFRSSSEEDPTHLFEGSPIDLAYTSGRRFLFELWSRGGWLAVGGAFSQDRLSTEQIAHPAKFGVDRPCEVTLPPWPDDEPEVVREHEAALGELQLYSLLVSTGSGKKTARLATVGWDGDRVSVVVDGAGRRSIRWRSVWDREQDALQFEREMRRRTRTPFRRNGRVVDWAWSDDARLARRLERTLAEHEQEELPDETDGASSARIEREVLRDVHTVPFILAGRWVNEEIGLSLPVPEGWGTGEKNGVPALIEDKYREDSAFLLATVLPSRASVADLADPEFLDAQLDATRADLSRREGLSEIELERVEVDGLTGFAIRLTLDAGDLELRQSTTTLFAGESQLVLVATCDRERWDDLGPEIERCIAGVSLSSEE